MADDEWDAEDFEIPAPVAPKVSDKWEGEDEDEPVKDSWEDDENEKNQAATPAPAVPAKKKAPKKLEEKIAEKERKAKEEAEQKRLMREENMTPEEKLADKLYRQKLVEESDFEMARETFGLSSRSSNREGSIDDASPSSKEEFAEFKSNVVKKLQSLSTQGCYTDFIEELVKDLCVTLDVEVLRKISQSTKSLHEEKQKMAKAASKGINKKGKTKLVLKMDRETDNYGDDFGGGEYDDFM